MLKLDRCQNFAVNLVEKWKTLSGRPQIVIEFDAEKNLTGSIGCILFYIIFIIIHSVIE